MPAPHRIAYLQRATIDAAAGLRRPAFGIYRTPSAPTAGTRSYLAHPLAIPGNRFVGSQEQ